MAGEFKRGRVTDFSLDGDDSAATYKSDTAEITLYLTYYKGVSRDAYIEDAARAIMQRYKKAEFLGDAVITPAQDAYPGVPEARLIRFTRTDGGTGYETGVWSYRTGPWQIKMRYTQQQNNETHILTALMGEFRQEIGKSGLNVTFASPLENGIPSSLKPIFDALTAIQLPAK